MSRPKLDPITLANMKRGARCPDCTSAVSVTPNGHSVGVHRIDVRHDDTCPTLARLRRTGKDRNQLALARTPGQTAAEFADEALAVADEMATDVGQPVGVLANPYALTPEAMRRPRGSRGRGRGRGRR